MVEIMMISFNQWALLSVKGEGFFLISSRLPRSELMVAREFKMTVELVSLHALAFALSGN